MIFISHNHADKPLVEHIAVKLAAAFGQDNVFYDSWSIQPGDGIIDRMSEALGKCTHFFFFVTEKSLKSKMVSLEWQNALIRSTKGHCKIVPVRCDKSEMPPIMTQSLYIDLYSVGLEAAVAQMADVVNGVNSFKGPVQPFSNLSFEVTGAPTKPVVTVKAKHYLEPIGSVMVLVTNAENEFTAVPINEDPYRGGFNGDIKLDNGMTVNGFLITVFRGITPAMPIRIQLESKDDKPVAVVGVLHQKSHERWESVPVEASSVSFAMKSAYK